MTKKDMVLSADDMMLEKELFLNCLIEVFT